MDFELSDEQTMLRHGLRALLESACPPSRVRAAAFGGDASDPELWSALADSGWPALTTPEAFGGAGLDFQALMLVAMEAGRSALHAPLTSTLLAARALATAPPSPARDDLLGRIAGGRSSVTLGLSGGAGDTNDDRRGRPRASRATGGGWVLHGSVPYVPYGPLASAGVFEAELPEGTGLFVVPTDVAGLAWVPFSVMDRSTPRFMATFDGARLPSDASLYGDMDAADAVAALTDEYRVVLAAESQGASERMLQLTVEYAKEREQFGRPIGSNQAVKVRIAQMSAAVERMRVAVYFAALKVDQRAMDRAAAVAMAKAATAGPAAFVGSQAIHVHGAIGFTWEHDVHFWVKRVKSNELLLGDEHTNLARLADAVFGPVGSKGDQ